MSDTPASAPELTPEELGALYWCVNHAIDAHGFSQLAYPGRPPVKFAHLRSKLAKMLS